LRICKSPSNVISTLATRLEPSIVHAMDTSASR
jgi:hypothetical protein